jgi:hypothetical protein
VVPTRFTKRSGMPAVVGGVLWIIYVGLWWAAGVSPPWEHVESESYNAASGILYMIGAGSLLASVVLTGLTAFGIEPSSWQSRSPRTNRSVDGIDQGYQLLAPGLISACL